MLINRPLLELYNWTKADFDKNTQGSAIRRIGFDSWIRNITIAIGNSPVNILDIKMLENKKLEFKDNDLMLKYIDW